MGSIFSGHDDKKRRQQNKARSPAMKKKQSQTKKTSQYRGRNNREVFDEFKNYLKSMEYEEQVKKRESENLEGVHMPISFDKKMSKTQENKYIRDSEINMNRYETQQHMTEPPMKISALKQSRKEGDHQSITIILQGSEESTEANLGRLDQLMHRAEMAKKYQKTLDLLVDLLREFAIEEKVTNQAFIELVNEYRQKDEYLSNQIMPWIIRIQQKIYSRLSSEINEMLNKKIHFPLQMMQLDTQQIDLTSKIQILTEELRFKIDKIQELEDQMFYQQEIVKIAQNQSKIVKFQNEQYDLKMKEVQGEHDRIKEKLNKFKDKLKKYRVKKQSSAFQTDQLSSFSGLTEEKSSAKIHQQSSEKIEQKSQQNIEKRSVQKAEQQSSQKMDEKNEINGE